MTSMLIKHLALPYTVQLNSNLTLVFDHSSVFTNFIRVSDCNENYGPGKKTVRADHFWSTKIGPGGPNLVSKIGPTQPKMVRCRILIEFIDTKCRKWCDTTLDNKCAAISYDAL